MRESGLQQSLRMTGDKFKKFLDFSFSFTDTAFY
jgi:hypothetical protein